MGRAVEAVTAEIGREEERQCGADLSSSPRDTHPDSLNSCNDRELEASSSICSSVTSTEKFSLLLSKLCCRLLKTCPLEQQNSVTLLSTFTLPVSESITVTHVGFTFPYQIIPVPSTISHYHVTHLDSLQLLMSLLKHDIQSWTVFEMTSDQVDYNSAISFLNLQLKLDFTYFMASSLCQFLLHM